MIPMTTNSSTNVKMLLRFMATSFCLVPIQQAFALPTRYFTSR